jgi:hypothetical protein
MFKSMRWLTLAAFFFLSGCAGIQTQKQHSDTTDHFFNGVDSVVFKTDKNIPIDKRLIDSTYLRLNSKFPLSQSSRYLLDVDSTLTGWEKTALEKINKNYSEFIEYMFGNLVADSEYVPKAHEITYLSLNLSLNHALMGRYDLAAVEARKIAQRELIIEEFNKKAYESISEQERFNANLGDEAHVISKIELIDDYPIEDFKSPKVRALKNSYQNASANYLSGFIFEAEGDLSLARPAYLKALNLNPNSTLFKDSVNKLNNKNNSLDKTELLVVIEGGIAPQLAVRRFKFGVPTNRGWRSANIALPIIDNSKAIEPRHVSVKLNSDLIPIEVTSETDVLLKRYLRDNMPKYLSMATTKALIQIASQITLSQSTKKLRQYDMGATEIIGSIAIEKFMSIGQPDIRTWSSLPSNMQMARVTINRGDHLLAVNTGTKSTVINLVASKPYQILNLRIVDGKVFYRPEILNSNLSNEYFDSIVSKPAETSVLKNITNTSESLINSLNFLKLKPNK